jgi:hypothetical protein
MPGLRINHLRILWFMAPMRVQSWRSKLPTKRDDIQPTAGQFTNHALGEGFGLLVFKERGALANAIRIVVADFVSAFGTIGGLVNRDDARFVFHGFRESSPLN